MQFPENASILRPQFALRLENLPIRLNWPSPALIARPHLFCPIAGIPSTRKIPTSFIVDKLLFKKNESLRPWINWNRSRKCVFKKPLQNNHHIVRNNVAIKGIKAFYSMGNRQLHFLSMYVQFVHFYIRGISHKHLRKFKWIDKIAEWYHPM